MFKTIKSDLPASIVVFFVALPLCLGIALASGAPLFSGLIAGIIGGTVVGAISGSKIGVSGPAAGLAAIVLTSIASLGGFENFLVAVVLGGVFQLILGVLKAGVIGYYFPSSVIKGMLTGIGIIIIMKQIPFFFGYDKSAVGFSLDAISFGSTAVGVLGLGLLILWQQVLSKKGKIFELIQGPLVVVVVGILFFALTQGNELLAINAKQLVSVPVPESIDSFLSQFTFPNFGVIGNKDVWVVAFTIAVVASLETLLCVEATDKLDPDKNVTPTNRELLAQGVGNILSGLVGGLPVTQVIVRSSANIQSGGKGKMSAIIHGILLLISVILIPTLLNKIPLSALAAILLIVGFKLAKPATFINMYKLGWKQFIPFMATVLPMVITGDLLLGIGLGLAVGVVVILFKSYQNSHFLHIEDKSNGVHKIKMSLAEEVTFFNKGAILKELDNLSENSHLVLDVRKTRFLDHDIVEILEDFAFKAKEKNIDIELISERGIVENPSSFIEFFKLRPKAS
ncbi:SulP family inorganic anion transporter [uncultured Tenacibaculum sp.]|uniref:SulP family inorganic anion transporter n=1 Tax=uncultured Tenacibaculum sp. TaxID=174713 RepID=UPI002628D96E|nr:SulP family inorganic anion transporter [uncultured Tenacibaculum sp.]